MEVTEEKYRGWQQDKVAEIAKNYLMTHLKVTIEELCGAVIAQMGRYELTLLITRSTLKNILTAEKRTEFSYARSSKSLCFTLSDELLLEMVEEMMSK